MTPDERDQIMYRLTACWPRPKMEPEQAAVWMDHLTPMDYPSAQKAIHQLEMTKTHRPSLAEMHESYRACRPHPAEQAMPALEEPDLTEDEQDAAREAVQRINAQLRLSAHLIGKPLGMSKREMTPRGWHVRREPMKPQTSVREKSKGYGPMLPWQLAYPGGEDGTITAQMLALRAEFGEEWDDDASF